MMPLFSTLFLFFYFTCLYVQFPLFSHLISFVRKFARSFFRSFPFGICLLGSFRTFVLVRNFVHSFQFASSYVRSRSLVHYLFVHSCSFSFICAFIRLFICSFFHCLVNLFSRSFVNLFDYPFSFISLFVR